MTAVQSIVQPHAPKAPKQDRAVVTSAPLEDVPRLIETNRRFAERQQSIDLHGRSLAQISSAARRHLLASALRYTRQYRDVAEPKFMGVPQGQPPGEQGPVSHPLFLAGHQPQLFHPGVWFKNFTLEKLAARHGGVAVNLVIDSDAVKEHALRVPGGSLEQPEVRSIPFDLAGPALPYEERQVFDRALFRSFAVRALPWLKSLVPEPMLADFWPLAEQRLQATGNLGEALSQARHIWEARWGSQTLELPQSAICESEAFHWFSAHLLAHLPRFWRIFNDALVEFRQQNKLRSATHPVPNLTSHDDWLEAPLWMWTPADPRRRPLFARQAGDRLQLTDRQGWQTTLPLSPDSSAERAAAALSGLAEAGVKIRTRALLTTLWARVSLGDLFLHGIGGAKYDQLTDRLICRFLGLQPPRYLTVSATLLLPVTQDKPSADSARDLDQWERELLYHPEKFLDAAQLSAAQRADAERLVANKQVLLHEVPTPGHGRDRHRGLRAMNEQLQPFLANVRQQLDHRRTLLAEQQRRQSILGSREYAFCLYPADTLRDFFQAALS